MDLKVQPIQMESLPSAHLAAAPTGSPTRTSPPPITPDLVELVFNIRARIAEEVLNLGVDPAAKRANLERLREEGEANRSVRKALREEAAAEARIRRKEREEAAIRLEPDGRIRLAYSASELREILQTARRLNIQA